MNNKTIFPYRLFVEGVNDLHVVSSLCENHKLTENFNIEACGSDKNVIRQFKIAITNPAVYQRIGIMVDADNDVKGRWMQLVDILMKSGKYDCENLELPLDGLVLYPLNSCDAIIGIWIMPNNNLEGMLEDFVLQLVSSENVLMQKPESTLSELEAEEIQQYKRVHRSKAKVHTFLAWQDEPGRPMGQAITARVLNPEAEQARVFIDWLNKMYN